MLDILQRLIESLREELSQYGEMLRLLEQEQELVVHRLPADLLQTVTSINSQGAEIQAARRRREEVQRQLAASLEQPENTALTEIIPRLPPEYQPLLEALRQENNQLLLRIHQRARQNHLLLNRSLELMQQFINTLSPVNAPVYNETGGILPTLLQPRSTYDAVG
ncbi:MAG: flagellar protein FlgN [Candidatus Omnitrophica bacterium]|nr:flagellar protein FlgN [Candidatus Omnitrophota bacterium]